MKEQKLQKQEQKEYISRFIQKALAKKTWQELNDEVEKIKDEELASKAGVKIFLVGSSLFFAFLITCYFLFR